MRLIQFIIYFCRQLCMFWVLTPIIRSSYNCNYSFWYWLTGSTTIRSRCWVGTQQRERTVVDANMQSRLQKYNKLNKSHLVGQLLKTVPIVKTSSKDQLYWALLHGSSISQPVGCLVLIQSAGTGSETAQLQTLAAWTHLTVVSCKAIVLSSQ